MLKNKRALILPTLILFAFSSIQADWHDTLRWLQNNAKRQNVTRDAAVVGVAALCAIGIGCWLWRPKPVKVKDFTTHVNNKKIDGFCSYTKLQKKGYCAIALYYTDSNEQALNCLNKHFGDKFFSNIQQLSQETMQNYFTGIFQVMNTAIKSQIESQEEIAKEIGFHVKSDTSDLLSAGILLIDEQKRRLYGATIGDIEIYKQNINNPIVPVAKGFLGQKDTITSRDIKVGMVEFPNYTGALTFIIGRKSRGTPQDPSRFPSNTFDFSTDGTKELSSLLAEKDVSIALKISY